MFQKLYKKLEKNVTVMVTKKTTHQVIIFPLTHLARASFIFDWVGVGKEVNIAIAINKTKLTIPNEQEL